MMPVDAPTPLTPPPPAPAPATIPLRQRLAELAVLFLKLGALGFGGPAAHVAMMEDECVRRRNWLSRQQFLDLVGATHLIPGPNSTEMTMHIGMLRAGYAGLLVAGMCFILPAMLIVGVLAWAYVNFGTRPEAVPMLLGIKPAVLGLIFWAVLRLGRDAVKDHRLALLGAAVVAGSISGMNEVVLLLGGAMVGMSWRRLAAARHDSASGPAGGTKLLLLTLLPGAVIGGLLLTASLAADGPQLVPGPMLHLTPDRAPVAWWDIGFYFLKIGSVIYGGGYVLVAFLEAGLVHAHHWLTPTQLLDAIAIGQVTPGPVFTTATFVGYLVTATPGDPASGVPGAVAATVGIFGPSFLFVAALSHLMPHLRRWTWTSAFIDAVNVCAVGLMAAVLIKLSEQFLVNGDGRLDWRSVGIASAVVIVMSLRQVNSAAIVLVAGLAGWLMF